MAKVKEKQANSIFSAWSLMRAVFFHQFSPGAIKHKSGPALACVNRDCVPSDA